MMRTVAKITGDASERWSWADLGHVALDHAGLHLVLLMNHLLMLLFRRGFDGRGRGGRGFIRFGQGRLCLRQGGRRRRRGFIRFGQSRLCLGCGGHRVGRECGATSHHGRNHQSGQRLLKHQITPFLRFLRLTSGDRKKFRSGECPYDGAENGHQGYFAPPWAATPQSPRTGRNSSEP